MFLAILLEEIPKPDNWDDVLSEYVDVIKTPKSETIFDLTKKILYTDWKINFLFGTNKYYAALHVLKIQYDKEIAEMVMNCGYNLIEELEDREAYLKQIYFVERQAKTLIVILNQYDKEYKLLCPEDEQKAGRKRADYEKEIAILSKFQHYRINPNEETVSSYCAIVNSYIEYARRAAI